MLRWREKGTWFYPLLSAALTVVMVVLLLPPGIPRVMADSHETLITPPPAFENLEPPIPPAEPVPPQRIAVNITPELAGIVTSPSEKIQLNLPKGAVSANVEVELAEYTPSHSDGMRMLNLFELNAKLVSSGAKVSEFNQELTITIQHTPDELAGLDTDSLRLYCLNEKTLMWEPVTTSKYDDKNGLLTATINHFSFYGEPANPEIAGPGKVMAAQVSLSSGAAVFSYPLELPPGPGGFRPQLELSYNSGAVDGMKNKQSVGSWMGIGWNLKLGSVSYDAEGKSYSLDFSGGSFELFTLDGIRGWGIQPGLYV